MYRVVHLISQKLWGPGSQVSIFQFSVSGAGTELFVLYFPLIKKANLVNGFEERQGNTVITGIVHLASCCRL